MLFILLRLITFIVLLPEYQTKVKTTLQGLDKCNFHYGLATKIYYVIII